MTNIKYLSGIPGSGKTTQVINHIVNNLIRNNYLIVLPTIELCEQVRQSFINLNISVDTIETINSDNKHLYDTNNTVQHLKVNMMNDKKIIITTFKTFELSGGNLPNKESYKLFVDEYPNVINKIDLNFGMNKSRMGFEMDLFNSLLKPVKSSSKHINNSGYTELKLNTKAMRKALAKNDNDFIVPLKELSKSIENPHKEIYVSTKQFDNVKNNKAKLLSIYQYLLPTLFDGFKDVVLMGANLQLRLIYKAWNVNWIKLSDCVEYRDIQKLPESKPVNSNQKIEIAYLSENRLSKHKFSQITDSTVRKSVINSINDFFNGEEFIFNANNEKVGFSNSWLVKPLKNCTRIKCHTHGLNKYNSFNNFACLPITNADEGMIDFVEHCLEVPNAREVLFNELSFDMTFQSVNRIKLRNSNWNGTVKILVGDRDTANKIAHFYDNDENDNVNTVKLNHDVASWNKEYDFFEKKLLDVASKVNKIDALFDTFLGQSSKLFSSESRLYPRLHCVSPINNQGDLNNKEGNITIGFIEPVKGKETPKKYFGEFSHKEIEELFADFNTTISSNRLHITEDGIHPLSKGGHGQFSLFNSDTGKLSGFCIEFDGGALTIDMAREYLNKTNTNYIMYSSFGHQTDWKIVSNGYRQTAKSIKNEQKHKFKIVVLFKEPVCHTKGSLYAEKYIREMTIGMKKRENSKSSKPWSGYDSGFGNKDTWNYKKSQNMPFRHTSGIKETFFMEIVNDKQYLDANILQDISIIDLPKEKTNVVYITDIKQKREREAEVRAFQKQLLEEKRLHKEKKSENTSYFNSLRNNVEDKGKITYKNFDASVINHRELNDFDFIEQYFDDKLSNFGNALYSDLKYDDVIPRLIDYIAGLEEYKPYDCFNGKTKAEASDILHKLNVLNPDYKDGLSDLCRDSLLFFIEKTVMWIVEYKLNSFDIPIIQQDDYILDIIQLMNLEIKESLKKVA